MTVPVQTPFNTYTASAGATVFTFTFKIASADDLVVLVNDVQKAINVDYTLNIATDGGDVVFVSPLIGGEAITIKRDIKLERETDYQQNGDFLSPTVNKDFDRMMMIAQQQTQDTSRSIKLPFETLTDQTISKNAAQRANKAVIFDSDGNVAISEDDYNDQAANAAASAQAALQSANSANSSAIASANAAASSLQSSQSAAASAARINLPIITSADAGKLLQVNEAGTGYKNTDDFYTKEEIDSYDKSVWQSKPIGEPFYLWTFGDDTLLPPTDQDFRFVKLTANDAYNGSILIDQVVDGTFPAITAYGTLDLADSPLHNKQIPLINTMRLHLRPSDEVEQTIVRDALQGHEHTQYRALFSQGHGGDYPLVSAVNALTPTTGVVTDGVNGTPRTANETRVQHITVTAFMRVK